jgi:triphosphatase
MDPDRARPQAPMPAIMTPLGGYLHPGDPVGMFFAKAIRDNLDVLAGMSSKITDCDDPEVIHDARVAIRRIRTCISLYDPGSGGKIVRVADARLRRLFRALGEVRDLDVLLQDVYAYSKRLGDRRAKEFVSFVNDCMIRRSKALARADTIFGSAELRDTCNAADLLIDAYLKRGNDASRAVEAGLEAPVIIAGTYGSLLAFDPALRADGVPVETYHATRRAAKRLRYSIEFLGDAIGAMAMRCHADVKALQDRLGMMNDTFSAVRRVMGYLSQSEAGTGNTSADDHGRPGPEVARYLAARQAEARQLAAGFPRAWARVSSPVFRKRLFTALGTIPKP